MNTCNLKFTITNAHTRCHYFETETLKTILSSQIPIKKHSPGDKILFVKNYTE